MATTIRYLYATSWLPCDERQHTVAVPGGSTTAYDTAANLLHTALWNLRRQGIVELRQLRPLEKEPVTVLARPCARPLGSDRSPRASVESPNSPRPG